MALLKEKSLLLSISLTQKEFWSMVKEFPGKSFLLPDSNLPNKFSKLEEVSEVESLIRLLLKRMFKRLLMKALSEKHMPIKPEDNNLLILKDSKSLLLEEDYLNFWELGKTKKLLPRRTDLHNDDIWFLTFLLMIKSINFDLFNRQLLSICVKTWSLLPWLLIKVK